MPAMVRIQNKQAQTLNILLMENGKASTKSLLPRAIVDVEASALTRTVFDLVQRGHIALNAVGMEEAKPEKASKKKDEL